MKKDFFKEGKIYSDNGYGKTYIFEIVDKIPSGYGVWNIPEICGGEYIPICISEEPGNKNCFSVNTAALKAIKVNRTERNDLHNAASCGVRTIAQAKKNDCTKSKNQRHGTETGASKKGASNPRKNYKIAETPARASVQDGNLYADDGEPKINLWRA